MATEAKPLSNERIAAIYSHSLPPTAWRNLDDAEMPGAIEALVKAGVPKKEAGTLSWTRRLVVSADGGTPLLAIHGAYKCDVSPWPVLSHGWPLVVGMAEGLELLNSERNPEAYKAERLELARKHQAEFDARDKRFMDALRAQAGAERKIEEERATYRADDWALLTSTQRLAAKLALAFQTHGQAELAADLRKALTESLAPATADDFPRDPRWAEGIDFGTLTPARRNELAAIARGEREEADLVRIPVEKLSSLRAMYGSNNAAIIQHWGRLQDARKAREATL
jgi:hypothetical protein